ncbi:7TM diverse intracellular signaling domain-containing protein [Salibacterium aidingense]|uniref:7TM diverse intracellular signaling domain-containing protein n=1 Tax=Salibacterium aidingense TaxID=384933 RepID=UPI0003FB7BDA|nr:7TM diverse intracellular signaling domain-containing protein [Salibacterium aidingense]
MGKRLVCSMLSILLFLLTAPGQASAAVQLEDEIDTYNISENMEWAENKESDWSIEEVTDPSFSGQFIKNKKGIPNYGYTTSNYWIRFEVENRSAVTDWVLEVAYPPHDSITFFEVQEDGIQSQETGDQLPFQERDKNHRNFAFTISVPPGETASYYLKFDTEGAMQLPLTWWKEDAFTEKSQTEYMILGLYYGLAAVMILYNLFLYFSLQQRSYLWYVLFILSLVLTHFTLNGAAFQFLWSENMWWNNRAIVFFMAASQALALLFAKSFLNTKRHAPRMDRLFTIFAVTQVMILLLLMVSYTAALNLVIISAVLLVITILTTAGLCWKQGYRPARYFFIGWVIFLIGVLVSSLADAGIIPVTFYTRYASQIGSAFEVVLFSLALADKFNTLRMEKEMAERRAKESQAAAVQQLQRANRLKDEFLANTSHELRTPLNGIIGIAESMYDGAAGTAGSSFQHNLAMIIQSGKRLSHLVNDLLDISKLRHKEIELEWKAVSLKNVVQVVLSISKPLLHNKEVTLINNIPDNLPMLAADENRLQQILHNIIGNAIKFTNSGTITLSARLHQDEIELTVADTGIGMTEEDKATLFHEFEQGRDARKQHPGGTGLGLSITKKLVELHGGTIAVESERKKGTNVYIRLPAAEDDRQAVSTLDFPLYEGKEDVQLSLVPPVEAPPSSKGHILIADDEPVNLQVLWNQLTLEGYQVTTAGDGEEVIALIDDDSPPFHLIILDVMMPKKSGYEVSRELRKRFTLTELPILILTARNELEDVVATFQAGANDYLAKPCYKEELTARVKTLLTLERVMEEIVEKQTALRDVNEELAYLNQQLEDRVRSRTAELEQKTEELLRMEKSRRHLLSNISHELGTPMTSLQGYVKAMMDGVIEAGDSAYLKLVYDKVLFMDRLIQDLYDLSKLEARQVRFRWNWINVHDFVQEFLLKFKAEVEAQHFTFFLKDKTDPYCAEEFIFADLDRLEQVMINLIYNAVKYTEEHGTLSIEIMPSASYLSNIPHDAEPSPPYLDRHLLVGVHDSGTGIVPDLLPYIFDRFFRGETARSSKDGSTGLGLAISKEIIEYHNGLIWAESTDQKGSSFYFMLPLYPGRLK